MKEFDILNRNAPIHQHCLIEASAGTGKTFSIQHIISRLLIETPNEQDPLSLQQILVVTFTRAAVRDLKNRIRSNIEFLLSSVESHLFHQPHMDPPDYLKCIFEKGNDYIEKAYKRLQQALFLFDQSQIFTIHSFCARMLRQFALESDLGLQAQMTEDALPEVMIKQVIADFFRTELHAKNYFPSQIAILLKQDPEQEKLRALIQSDYSFLASLSLQNIVLQFFQKMKSLKQQFNLSSVKMMADFNAQSNHYRNHKQGCTKAEILSKIEYFSALFDQEEWTIENIDRLIYDGIVWVEALQPSLLKEKKSKISILHYPSLTLALKNELYPLIQSARDFSLILSTVASQCRELFRRRQSEEEILAPDDLLRKMKKAVQHPSFLLQIRKQYEAAIIDEFQDTDPLQWEIFRKIFFPEDHSWQGRCYLVGDPKQSIYSFRQADIYTYIDAAQMIGKTGCYSLRTNYRSQPALVNALNFLFSSKNIPSFMTLPKLGESITYEAVQSGSHVQNVKQNEHRGAIHFFCCDRKDVNKIQLIECEREVFFPFILQEIKRLRTEKNIPFHSFAILVRDRNQGARLATFFSENDIPHHNQRGTSIVESKALASFTQCMQMFLQPQNKGTIRIALSSPLIGWSYDEIIDEKLFHYAMHWIQELRSCLLENGFAFFFRRFLHVATKPNGNTITETILEQKNGMQFYEDLEKIADLVIDHQHTEWRNEEGIISFLDKLHEWNQYEDERVKRFQDPLSDGVKIITIHVSKGLEFDTVFALGLINRTMTQEDLIPFLHEDKVTWIPVENYSDQFQKYCEEQDAEKLRQLYVACTRAKTRLYIPVILHTQQQQIEYGTASPMDLFLARFRQPVCNYKQLYERIQTNLTEKFIPFLEDEGREHSITYSIDTNSKKDAFPFSKKEQHDLICPPAISFSFASTAVSSFSSLAQHAHVDLPQVNFPLLQTNEKNVHTLPASIETGKCIHRILEKINFQDFAFLTKEKEAIPLIKPFVQQTIFEEWIEVIASIIYRTMRETISCISEHFSFSQLKHSQIYREMPFIYSQPDGGFMKGVIDLVFFYEGYYYLVDWKTNWLGEGDDSYTISHLERVMHANDYFLQSTIYTEALQRYVHIVDQRPFEDCFGGILFIFVRGLKNNKEMGIYRLRSGFCTL